MKKIYSLTDVVKLSGHIPGGSIQPLILRAMKKLSIEPFEEVPFGKGVQRRYFVADIDPRIEEIKALVTKLKAASMEKVGTTGKGSPGRPPYHQMLDSQLEMANDIKLVNSKLDALIAALGGLPK